LSPESYPPLEANQVPDFILNDPDWLAHVELAEAKLAELDPFLKAEYSRILELCRKKTGDEGAADVAEEVIRELLVQIQIALYVEMDVSRIRESAAYKYRNPAAWLTRAAMHTVKDFFKKQSRRRKSYQYIHELPVAPFDDGNGDVNDGNVIDGLNRSIHSTPLRNRERYLLDREQRASNRAFVKHYRAALPRLSLPRRRAWVLCNDKFLEPDEVEKLLKLKSAHAARAAWPEGMPIKEAARLLRCAEGTVSSNISRARDDLRRELADLDPLKSSRAPVGKWHVFLSNAFGVRGSLEQIVFAITPLLGPLPAKVSGGPAVMARPASDLIIDYARAIRRPLPIPANQERVSEPTQDVEHNSRPRRANLPFPKGLKRIAYRCGSYMKGCRNCGEMRRIRTKSGRKKTVYQSGYAVFRAYTPSETGWTFWCYECGAMDTQCWAKCKAELGRAAVIRPKSQQVYKTDKYTTLKSTSTPDQSQV
jgi:DNA-directed RNA polymerase specialized sigma24 family protein